MAGEKAFKIGVSHVCVRVILLLLFVNVITLWTNAENASNSAKSNASNSVKSNSTNERLEKLLKYAEERANNAESELSKFKVQHESSISACAQLKAVKEKEVELCQNQMEEFRLFHNKCQEEKSILEAREKHLEKQAAASLLAQNQNENDQEKAALAALAYFNTFEKIKFVLKDFLSIYETALFLLQSHVVTPMLEDAREFLNKHAHHVDAGKAQMAPFKAKIAEFLDSAPVSQVKAFVSQVWANPSVQKSLDLAKESVFSTLETLEASVLPLAKDSADLASSKCMYIAGQVDSFLNNLVLDVFIDGYVYPVSEKVAVQLIPSGLVERLVLIVLLVLLAYFAAKFAVFYVIYPILCPRCLCKRRRKNHAKAKKRQFTADITRVNNCSSSNVSNLSNGKSSNFANTPTSVAEFEKLSGVSELKQSGKDNSHNNHHHNNSGKNNANHSEVRCRR